MALKAKLKKEEFESLSEEIKSHYVEKDDNFVLDITSVDGMVLENVDGLKSTVGKLRSSEKTLTQNLSTLESSLKEMQEKYKDIDADQARDLMSKVDEIKNWKGEDKVKEAVKVAESRLQSKIDELVGQHKKKTSDLQDELEDTRVQLQDAIVNSKIIESITKAGGNVELLMPHVKNSVQMIADSSGKFKPQVIDMNGNPRIGNVNGDDMTIDQFIGEMKTKDVFAAAFNGTNSSGPGNRGSEDGKSKNTPSKVKTIKASDSQAMSKNLEDIATGKVQVEMDSSD
jgi:hypothetical protein